MHFPNLNGDGIATITNLSGQKQCVVKTAADQLISVHGPAKGEGSVVDAPWRVCAGKLGTGRNALQEQAGVGYEWRPSEDPTYFPGRQASVLACGKTVGHFGVVHPKVSRSLHIPSAGRAEAESLCLWSSAIIFNLLGVIIWPAGSAPHCQVSL